MNTQRALDLEKLKLLSGSHPSSAEGFCVMSWNDTLDDEGRQKLKPFIPRLVGTRAPFEIEQKRGLLVADWYLRVHVPAWLELGGMKEHADQIRALPELASWSGMTALHQPMNDAKAKAAAARDAAWDAAWDAAGDAAWDAAGDAAYKASREKLKPTEVSLQASAFELLEKLIMLGSDQKAVA